MEDKLSKNEVVIEAKNISRSFKLTPEKIDNFKEYIIKKVKREIRYDEFMALENISFKVRKGDKLGILGPNGAGKSTLLKIVAGVMKPSKGTIKTTGRIAPMIELGAGFDRNYTGRENIFLNGAILGFSREFLENKFDEIVEFSELGRFIDIPIKNYSSGMRSKLGFAVSTLVKPDILILDEVLSVGDTKFRIKSRNKIDELFNEGVTVILVSHNIYQIRSICNRAIWLENGKLIMEGDVNEVCDAYQNSLGVFQEIEE